MATTSSDMTGGDASPIEAQASAALTKVKTLKKPPPTTNLRCYQRYLPCPSRQRQHESLQETPFNLSKDDEPKPKTILYLAYGSNLCAETFLGKRGIRPLSQINVAVPALVMTFDLAGLPYTEPCFANTAYRHHTEKPPTEKSENTPLLLSQKDKPKYHKNRWLKPLVGVVYEVTPADFAHIIATEGGGASYHDILVDCHPLPAGTET
ncbi:MAG: hypothetical protein Q9191_005150, partial [Dirinaria sp. TL-2023a]